MEVTLPQCTCLVHPLMCSLDSWQTTIMLPLVLPFLGLPVRILFQHDLIECLFDCTRYCFGQRVITALSGAINNPERTYTHYQNSANCGWLINPTGSVAGSRLQLTIPSFITESGWDVLTAYDGNSTSAPVLASYSGTQSKIIFITASTPVMYLTFTSDSSGTAPGFSSSFNGTFSFVCKNIH